MANLKVQKKYGEEKFSRLFNILIDEKINSIKIKIKNEIKAEYNDINYSSTNKKEVNKNE